MSIRFGSSFSLWPTTWGTLAQAGPAQGGKGLVVAQPSGEADKDGVTDGAPCPAVCCHSGTGNSVTAGAPG